MYRGNTTIFIGSNKNKFRLTFGISTQKLNISRHADFGFEIKCGLPVFFFGFRRRAAEILPECLSKAGNVAVAA